MNTIGRLSCVSTLAFALASMAAAQTTSGSIAGSVVDRTQAAIGNATVKIADEAKGFTLTATTDSVGRFV